MPSCIRNAGSIVLARRSNSQPYCGMGRGSPQPAHHLRSLSNGRMASNIGAVSSRTRASAGACLRFQLVASAPTGTWRVRAFSDPSGPQSAKPRSWSRTMFRIGWNSNLQRLRRVFPRQFGRVTIDGRYLYGAPAAGLELEGEVVIGVADERAGFPAINSGWPTTRRNAHANRSTACPPPTAPARPSSRLLWTSNQKQRGRSKHRSSCAWPNPAVVPWSERPRFSVAPSGPMIGVKRFSPAVHSAKARMRRLRLSSLRPMAPRCRVAPCVMNCSR